MYTTSLLSLPFAYGLNIWRQCHKVASNNVLSILEIINTISWQQTWPKLVGKWFAWISCWKLVIYKCFFNSSLLNLSQLRALILLQWFLFSNDVTAQGTRKSPLLPWKVSTWIMVLPRVLLRHMKYIYSRIFLK